MSVGIVLSYRRVQVFALNAAAPRRDISMICWVIRLAEPYLITLAEDAVPYTHFRHAGIEFLYMLSGKVWFGKFH